LIKDRQKIRYNVIRIKTLKKAFKNRKIHASDSTEDEEVFSINDLLQKMMVEGILKITPDHPIVKKPVRRSPVSSLLVSHYQDTPS